MGLFYTEAHPELVGFLDIRDALQTHHSKLLYDGRPIGCQVFPEELFAFLNRCLNSVTEGRHGWLQSFRAAKLLKDSTNKMSNKRKATIFKNMAKNEETAATTER